MLPFVVLQEHCGHDIGNGGRPYLNVICYGFQGLDMRVVARISVVKKLGECMKYLLIVLVLSLSGCVGYVHDGGYYHDDGYHGPHDNRNGGFCPPGQAKKGNC